ncbi:hypothetical protein FIBSPDRAFT_795836 [Athelia psychrophila]|uniref:BZIP domain-containing protein n=1 Tax=Athelia psychrophila TaxID=1759441 RepID=A0A166DZ60_9AGAM|nr:hypothetical protein FIBSPDRAFT_795836 [Fibularhizoctonia sp. CBS 109695]
MDAYPGVTPLWDLSQATTFSQLPDDDFLALLQKQFPTSNEFSFQGGINPQEIQPYALPGLSPPSDDSSPSPQSANNERDAGSRSRSRQRRSGDSDGDDPMLKRKASDDSLDDEPSSKNQNTGALRSSVVAYCIPDAACSRRQAIEANDGTTVKVNRRKEQNRAAQRAFRERKEKHVKDLEDKVAELEAKNDQASSENVNLRDLLTRLQDENVTLKQAAFTFSVPKSGAHPPQQQQQQQQPVASGSRSHSSSSASGMHMFSPSISSSSSSSSLTSPVSAFSSPTSLAPHHAQSPASHMAAMSGGDMDWTALTTFDPAMLNLLDESPPPEPTATATASQMFTDFGYGHAPAHGKSPFTTIAANPQFMSFADFDFDSEPASANGGGGAGAFNFDMWAQPSPDPQAFSPPRDHALDDLFGGNGYAPDAGLMDFNALMAASSPSLIAQSPGVSPVVHQYVPQALQPQPHHPPHQPHQGTSGSSSSSSASASTHSPQSSAATSPDAAPPFDPDAPCDGTGSGECPKTKEDIAKAAAREGPSAFVTSPVSLREGDAVMSEMTAAGGDLHKVMSCKGQGFPRTDPRPDDVEVLTAWRGITNAPGVQDSDIASLCSEFSSKAKCDGTKVVLDHSTYQSMLAKLAQARSQQK